MRPMGTDQVVVGIGPVPPDDVVRVARAGHGVRLADEALAEIARSRDVVDRLAKDDRPHYGVSTGFGALATRHIPLEQRAQLQRSLVRSHAAGWGARATWRRCPPSPWRSWARVRSATAPGRCDLPRTPSGSTASGRSSW